MTTDAWRFSLLDPTCGSGTTASLLLKNGGTYDGLHVIHQELQLSISKTKSDDIANLIIMNYQIPKRRY